MNELEVVEAELEDIENKIQALEMQHHKLSKRQKNIVAESLGLIGATIECDGDLFLFDSIYHFPYEGSLPWVNCFIINKDGSVSNRAILIRRDNWKIVEGGPK